MTSKYKSEFKEVRPLGSGGFSTVFEVKYLKDKVNYAVKKIPFENIDEIKMKTLKEVEFLCKLQSKYVIKFIDSWIETNYYLTDQTNELIDKKSLLLDKEKTVLLHIQMELCPVSLEKFIKLISAKNKNSMTAENYSIVCEIFVELLESIQYLHQQNPPIIHRDLKPDNVMLTNKSNDRKVKLTDFGLSTYHEFVDQSKSKYVGTKSFRAPELNGKNYDTKADIYSLGIVMQQMFNIDHNKESTETDGIIESKYINAREECLKCVTHVARLRPTCEQILSDKDSWFYVDNDPKYSGKLSFRQLIKEFNIFEGRYGNEFKENRLLLQTPFVAIFEAINRKNNQIYSVKKIAFSNEDRVNVLKEIDILFILNTKYVVKYIDHWIENNYYLPYDSENNLDDDCFIFDPHYTLLLHIQLEFYSIRLTDYLKQRADTETNVITLRNYSIACNILVQLLECVNYLHRFTPPIIHRNLKPTYIILFEETNGFKVKLDNFSLSTFHEFNEQSHTKLIGTRQYMAPEANDSYYDTKVDIYSLGIIIEEMFNIDFDEENENDMKIRTKYEYLKELCMNCVQIIAKRRPACNEILKNKDKWFYSDQ